MQSLLQLDPRVRPAADEALKAHIITKPKPNPKPNPHPNPNPNPNPKPNPSPTKVELLRMDMHNVTKEDLFGWQREVALEGPNPHPHPNPNPNPRP